MFRTAGSNRPVTPRGAARAEPAATPSEPRQPERAHWTNLPPRRATQARPISRARSPPCGHRFDAPFDPTGKIVAARPAAACSGHGGADDGEAHSMYSN